MFRDFREFISRGSVIDLAIGVIMGAAFTAIVNSLVDDIFMPLIGILMGGVDFESLIFQVGEASIAYGLFIQAVVNFFLVAIFIFFVTRAIVAMQKDLEKGKPDEPEAEQVPPQDVQLLMEIRDLLKTRDSNAVSE